MPASYWLVMPAAGSGQRFGSGTPKQYASLAGRTVIEYALAPFLADRRCSGAILALAEGDSFWAAVSSRNPGIKTVTGGAERSHSVRNALTALMGRARPEDWVAVHDAARPCLTPALLERVVSAAMAHTVGALLAMRVTDTLKRELAGEAAATVDRSQLWAAQTPQVFRYGELCSALDAAFARGIAPTDEAQSIEWLGRRPLLVEGSADNLKITNSQHLTLASSILAGSAACA